LCLVAVADIVQSDRLWVLTGIIIVGCLIGVCRTWFGDCRHNLIGAKKRWCFFLGKIQYKIVAFPTTDPSRHLCFLMWAWETMFVPEQDPNVAPLKNSPYSTQVCQIQLFGRVNKTKFYHCKYQNSPAAAHLLVAHTRAAILLSNMCLGHDACVC
jgi:hypothetical protein